MTRLAVVEKDKCNQERCGGLLCAKVCPINKAGSDCVFEGDDKKARIEEELCIGCNICVMKCPVDAISIINLPEQLEDAPVHRYGEQQHLFALYNLPVPIFGKVVGIIGRNGIGKSTAMGILAGTLQPNFATPDGADVDELIKRFKGTEAQAFFEKLRDEKIKIAFKPQMVDSIPKAFKGTVQELLEKTNQKDDAYYKSILEMLELEHLLDRKIDVISGGELQRVAIAATALKDANVYFFDEPTSYLDIKQRLKVAQFIKSLATEETAVMVIEHDLIILDYLTDLMHLVYGKENVYGIISHPKASKNGINTYLSGFMKDENIRFRDHQITFSEKPPFESLNDELLVTWPEIKVKKGSFSLEAKPGDIYKHDIIGILGENGIGKTTFMNEIAKMQLETKAGEGKIAFKPQALDATDTNVGEFLQEAMQYEQQLMKPLDLEPLLERNLNELSGGQLQRVFIARTLAQDADLYLLDEPSAYLDIEQRLILSKVIRDMMEAKGKAALIIDHDLLFIDYISQKLVIFDGLPGREGNVNGPMSMEDGMNTFLKDIQITFRRDDENHRPRANKLDSQMDREQKSTGKLYYTG
ncbi:MAG: ribosome biogenesis/translation initiation ATPase RLI [Candidatus Woesearchaeota archaeon]|nr:ribosome biogenesis/translation initiation ATPase RLI [Candidatus Woesearchaeota archaeon]